MAENYTYKLRPAQSTDLPYLPAIEVSAATLFKSVPGLSGLADDEPMSEQQHRGVLDGWRSRGVHDGGTWVAVASPVPIHAKQSTDSDVSAEGTVVGFIVTELVHIGRTNGVAQRNDKKSGGPDQDVDRAYLHISELGISARHQRRGLAGKLIVAARDFARARSGEYQTTAYAGCATSNEHHHDAQSPFQIIGLSLTTFVDVPFNKTFYEQKFGFRVVDDEDVGLVVGDGGIRISREDGERLGRFGRRCFMVVDL